MELTIRRRTGASRAIGLPENLKAHKLRANDHHMKTAQMPSRKLALRQSEERRANDRDVQPFGHRFLG